MAPASLQLHATLRHVLSALVPDIADYGFIHLAEEDGSVREVAVSHRDPAREGRLMRMLRRVRPQIVARGTLSGHVVATGEVQRIEGPAARRVIESIPADRETLGRIREFLPRAFLVLPLQAGTDTLGSLSLARAETDLRFTDREVIFLGVIARQAALAIQNARLLEAGASAGDTEPSLSPEASPPLDLDELPEGLSPEVAPPEEPGSDVASPSETPAREASSPAKGPAADLRTPAALSMPYVTGAIGEILIEQLKEVKEEFVVRMLEIPDDNPLRRTFYDLARRVDRATSILSRLVDFSRHRRAVSEEVHLNVVVAEAVEGLERQARDQGIQIRVELDTEVGPVSVEERGLSQAMGEILRNALEAMPDGGRLQVGTTTARVSPTQAAAAPYPMHAGGYVCLRVRDNGPGMERRVLAQAFEPFFTTKDRTEHPGLGLTTVYGIARLSGGHVWLESRKGEGTRVDLYLPLARAKEKKKEEARGENRPTTLLVEGQADARDQGGRILRRAGLRVLEASSEAEALSLWRRMGGRVDALILDADTGPKKKPAGSQGLLDRARLVRPDLPVLYTSRMPRMDKAFPEMLDSNTRFVEKPFRDKQLMEKLAEVFPGFRSSGSVGSAG